MQLKMTRKKPFLFVFYLLSFSKNIFRIFLVYFPAYRISREKSLLFEEYGTWSRENGLYDVRRTPILSLRRRDLQGHLIVASGVILTPGAENFTDLDDYRYDKFVNKLSKPLTDLFFPLYFLL